MSSKLRSVVDLDSEDALRKALMTVRLPGDTNGARAVERGGTTPPETGGGNGEAEEMDWILPSCDPETTEAQSMREELHRLTCLKNYLILDSEKEEVFDRLTRLGARLFNVPLAIISLVDLGRQWFLSNRGLGEAREMPRKHAFCAHTILNKHNMLIVTDTTKDFRFKNNPVVLGPPNVRFYAGAPLLSPEGYKLGTFCILDDKARPAGLSEEEQGSLRDLADMAIREIVDRRQKMRNQQCPQKLIAYTAHDLMTPLTGVQLSLSLLKDDELVCRTLGVQQMELLSTAANCSDLMLRICQTSIDTLREECAAINVAQPTSQDCNSVPIARMSELVKSLAMIMEPIPKTVPMILSLDESVPPSILSDDLKLFRSALNLLSHAIQRTTLGMVWLRIFCTEEKSKLVFECADTGPDIPVEHYQYLYKPSQCPQGDVKVGLSSLASLVDSLGGEYGFSPLGMHTDGRREARRKHGSIFWFSVPLCETEGAGMEGDQDKAMAVLPSVKRMRNRKPGVAKEPIIPDFPRTSSGAFIYRVNSGAVIGRSGSANSVSSNSGRFRFGVHREDPFHSGSLHNGRFCDPPGSSTNAAVGMVDQGEASNKRKPAAIPSRISLPKQPDVQVDDEDEEEDPKHAAGRKRRALVIEDSLVVRKSLARALDKLGYEVTQAPNGLEGLKCLKEKLFDLTLCDFLMPVMDGMDCVKQFRGWEKTNRPWFSAWIVGISAHANANDGGQGIIAGMDDFKPKPVSIKDLGVIQASEPVVERTRKLDQLEASIRSSENPNDRSDALTTVSMDQDLSEGRKRPEAEMVRSDRSSPIGGRVAKRVRTSSDEVDQTQSLEVSSNPVCLMATDKPSRRTNEVLLMMERDGWKVVVVNDGREAVRLLKMRNWDAVLIEDELPLMNGASCVESFRRWEEENRVNRQLNTFLVCSENVPSPSDATAVVLPPTGFDGILNRPLVWRDLDYLLKKNTPAGRSYEIVVRRTEN